jgi:hypothetical protein
LTDGKKNSRKYPQLGGVAERSKAAVLKEPDGGCAPPPDGAMHVDLRTSMKRDAVPDGSIGARDNDRGKLVSMPAVKLRDAIAMLDGGDLSGARVLLVELVEGWGRVGGKSDG